MTTRLALAAGLALVLAACAAGAQAPVPDPKAGVVEVHDPAVRAFYRRAANFYHRLAGRRFDSWSTFRDSGLRECFRDERAFADYYADLAHALEEAHIRRSRPLELEVEEFVVEGPGKARVRVRLIGRDGRPLRWGRKELVREDRWERIGGRWWIRPGRL